MRIKKILSNTLNLEKGVISYTIANAKGCNSYKILQYLYDNTQCKEKVNAQ